MGTWALLQVVFDIFLALGLFVVVMRLSRAPKDDPRLSRGLQLLQSKISVLEDLSDRSEQQVHQLTAILDQKIKEVQAKIQLADQHVHEIRVSMERSLDVAKIFQDKIPHEEIIERQNTIKYVHAARLAHQGLNADEIAAKVDLPKGEIEFIAKVNRDRLMFNEESLPEWAKQPATEPAPAAMAAAAQVGRLDFVEAASSSDQADRNSARLKAQLELDERQRLVENLSRLQFEMQNLDLQLARDSGFKDFSNAFQSPKIEPQSLNQLQKLGDEFRKACDDAKKIEEKTSLFPPLEQLTSLIPQMFQEAMEPKPLAEIAPKPATPHLAAVEPFVEASAEVKPNMTHVADATQESGDPALRRAMAQAKVQAALARGKAASPATTAKSAEPAELAQARELARESAASVSATINAEPAPMADAKAPQQSIIRRVEFPRIDSPY